VVIEHIKITLGTVKTGHDNKIQYIKKTSSLYKVMRSDHSTHSMNTYTMYHKTKPHLRDVIRFLNAEAVKPAEIYMRMLAKYGASCASNTQVFEWVQKFKNGV
jgi:hypothetical protein